MILPVAAPEELLILALTNRKTVKRETYSYIGRHKMETYDYYFINTGFRFCIPFFITPLDEVATITLGSIRQSIPCNYVCKIPNCLESTLPSTHHKLLISRAIGYGMWIPLASFGEWRSNLTSLFKNVGNAKAAEWICPETTITNCIQHRQFNQLYLHGYAIESWKASHVSILNCDVHLQQFSAENFPTSDKKDTEI